MKVKDGGKKRGFDISKLDPDVQPFLRKVQVLIKHCADFKIKHVLAKSKKYGLKLRKIVRSFHRNQEKLSIADEFLTGLRSLDFKLQDIEERAKHDMEELSTKSKTRD